MQTYPSIPSVGTPDGEQFHIFDKIDGSNIRAEWTKKRGFNKFGCRHRLIDDTDHQFGRVIPHFIEHVQEPLLAASPLHVWERATFFFEWHGPGSEYGNHIGANQVLSLIDVHVYRRGFLDPADFVALYYNVGIRVPNYLGRQNWNATLVSQVSSGMLPGMSHEGIVGKRRGRQGPDMRKYKSLAWLVEYRRRRDAGYHLEVDE